MKSCPFLTTIFLGNGLYTQVDGADWLLYAHYPWRAKQGRGGLYAACRIRIGKRQKWVYLHRLIAKCPKDKHVHHRDFNPLNNHRVNLQNMIPAEHDDLHKHLRIARKN